MKTEIDIKLLQRDMKQNAIDHDVIIKRLENIDKKLNDAISIKADKSEVTEVREDIDKMKSWVLYSVIGGIIIFAITQGLKYIEGLVR